MTYRIALLSLLLSLGLAPLAAAQDTSSEPIVHDPTYANLFDNVEIDDVRDDRRDRMRIRRLVRMWNGAVAIRNRVTERVADREIQAWLREEIREDRHEVTESTQELRAERQEARETGLRDDRADARDEAADRRRARADLRETRLIARRLRRMQPAFDQDRATNGQYTIKRRLLRRLVRLAAREVAQSREETREDREEWLESVTLNRE